MKKLSQTKLESGQEKHKAKHQANEGKLSYLVNEFKPMTLNSKYDSPTKNSLEQLNFSFSQQQKEET